MAVRIISVSVSTDDFGSLVRLPAFFQHGKPAVQLLQLTRLIIRHLPQLAIFIP